MALAVDNYIGPCALLSLTSTAGSLQVVWSVLNCNVNIFLLDLGVPASLTSIIWLAAPLCGTVVQPYMGLLSDRSSSRLGRRKSFILFGAIATIISLLGLAWSENIADLLCRGVTTPPSGSNNIIPITIITVLWVYAFSIAIQPLQMGTRALIIDACPQAQQPKASAWASSAAGIGNIIGYLMSFLPPPTWAQKISLSRFRYLTLVSCLCLAVTVCITIWTVQEAHVSAPELRTRKHPTASMWKHFGRRWHISDKTRTIYGVQFFAWMGWFPFLFYMTTFISRLDTRTRQDQPGTDGNDIRAGAFAGIIYAAVACLTSVLITSFLTAPLGRGAALNVETEHQVPVATLFTYPIEQVWCLSQLFSSILMFSTVLAFTKVAGAVLVGFVGVPWAITGWAPYALLGVEVLRHSSIKESERPGKRAFSGTGTTIGLHNAAISAPQVLAALLTSLIIGLSGRLGIQDSVGWVLRLGGCVTFYSAWRSRKLWII